MAYCDNCFGICDLLIKDGGHKKGEILEKDGEKYIAIEDSSTSSNPSEKNVWVTELNKSERN